MVVRPILDALRLTCCRLVFYNQSCWCPSPHAGLAGGFVWCYHEGSCGSLSPQIL